MIGSKPAIGLRGSELIIFSTTCPVIGFRLCPRTCHRRFYAAITRYKKALGDPVGLAELPVLYGERAAGFCREVDHRDTAYLDALVRTFEEALKATGDLTGKVPNGFVHRLESVRNIGRQLGDGVGEDMDVLL